MKYNNITNDMKIILANEREQKRLIEYNKQKTYLQTKLDEERFWYMKYVVLQKIFEDYGYTDTGVKDESIKYLYESITPEEVQECSQF